MGRTLRTAPVVGALVAATFLVGTAAAQTSPTTRPRTTVPTMSPQAASFPVLQTSDLPRGYQMGSGSPFEAGNQSPTYPTIDDCLWSFTNRFSGLTPDIYQSSFQGKVPVSGLNIAVVFDAAKPATAYYDNIDEAYRAATKCKMTTVPSSTGSSTVNYGKITPLAVGKLGDEAFGVTITPSSKAFPPLKYMVFRDGASVVQLRVTDPDMSLAEFTALAKAAGKRAS